MDTLHSHTRRNFRLNFLDGVFFAAGTAFFSHTGLVPLFVATLTDARWPVGLVTPVMMIGIALPQLLGAAYAARRPHFWFTVRVTTLIPRIALLALIAVPFLPRPYALPAFFAAWLTYALALGFCIPIWTTFIAQVIPANIRGTFFGSRTTAGGVAAMVGSVGAAGVLATLPGPLGFAACFALAMAFLTAAWFAFTGTRHDWRTFEANRPVGDAFWSDARTLIQTSRPFRRYLLMRICTTAPIAATGFYALHGVETFGLTTAQGSLLALAITFVPNMTAAAWGVLTDKLGNHGVQVGVIACAAVANIILAVAPTLPIYVGALVVAGLVTVINQLVDNKSMMELDAHRCGTLLGVLSLALTPAMFLFPLASGMLAEFAGMQAVFYATGAALAVATGLLVCFKPAAAAPTAP